MKVPSSRKSLRALRLAPSSEDRGRDIKLCIEGMGHVPLGIDLFAASSMEIVCHTDKGRV